MKICYFGIYQKDYPRNNILIKGLRENQVKVIECCSRAKGLKKYWELFFKHWRIRKDYDIMVIGFLGQSIIFFAKLLTRKPIILDAFVSLYNTAVFDRKRFSANSLKGRYFYFLDKYSCKLADKVLLDTQAHVEYFVKTFNLPLEKFHRIFVGSNDQIFYPRKKIKKQDQFLVHFHGYLVPFHGAKYILKAAEILKQENIQFQFITRFDKNYQQIKKQAEEKKLKINFIETVSYQKLAEYINQADVCLGVFGLTPKLDKVIPNKIYEALACQKPIITARVKVIEELLKDEENCLLVKTGNGQDLANKILELKQDQNLLEKIAKNGYLLYKERLRPQILGKELKEICFSLN